MSRRSRPKGLHGGCRGPGGEPPGPRGGRTLLGGGGGRGGGGGHGPDPRVFDPLLPCLLVPHDSPQLLSLGPPSATVFASRSPPRKKWSLK